MAMASTLAVWILASSVSTSLTFPMASQMASRKYVRRCARYYGPEPIGSSWLQRAAYSLRQTLNLITAHPRGDSYRRLRGGCPGETLYGSRPGNAGYQKCLAGRRYLDRTRHLPDR